VLIKDASQASAGASHDTSRRIRIAIGVAILGLVLLLGRLWQLQVMRGDSLYQGTQENLVRINYLPSVRGKILDRKGVPLADIRAAYNIYLTPGTAKKPIATPEVRATLARLLGLSDEQQAQVAERVELGRRRNPEQPVMVLEDQGYEAAAMVMQKLPSLPGVSVPTEPYRYYPRGAMAAHLLGYMNQMTAVEFDRLTGQGYDLDELVGRSGLEAEWENYLRGKKGFERYAVDAKGRRLDEATTASLIPGERRRDPTAGANLILTLDATMQQIAERAVGNLLAAAVAVVDVRSGRVLALVSKPSFDPNVMTGHLTHAEWELLSTDPRKPLIDKSVSGTYPPGSVFKFVTTFAAMEDGQAVEDEHIFCAKSYYVPGDLNKRDEFLCNGTHGSLSLLGAIQHSCNIYFWKLIERVGLDRLAEVANDYGFGTPTQLGLNGDAGGRVPTKAWYEQRGRFVAGFATNAATGQGDVEVTVLQMAMAYSALANRGTLFLPQVVDRVEAADGRVIVAYQPTVARQIQTPPDALDVWRRGMWAAVNEVGGSGYPYATSALVPIAGKTGTAEVCKKGNGRPCVSKQQDVPGWDPMASHAWFAGWAPAEAPEVAVVVLVEHGGSGGKVAGPIAKQIFEGWWQKVRGHDAAPSAPVAPAAGSGEVVPPPPTEWVVGEVPTIGSGSAP
jgi:penicillin-binding protein 2